MMWTWKKEKDDSRKKKIERKLALVVVSPDFSSKSDPHVKLTYGLSPFVCTSNNSSSLPNWTPSFMQTGFSWYTQPKNYTTVHEANNPATRKSSPHSALSSLNTTSYILPPPKVTGPSSAVHLRWGLSHCTVLFFLHKCREVSSCVRRVEWEKEAPRLASEGRQRQQRKTRGPWPRAKIRHGAREKPARPYKCRTEGAWVTWVCCPEPQLFYLFEALQPTSVLWSAFVFLNQLSVSVTILGSLAQFPVMKHKNLEVLVNIFWTTISAYNKVTAKIFSDDPKLMELFNILSWVTKTSPCQVLQLWILDTTSALPASIASASQLPLLGFTTSLPPNQARLQAGGSTLLSLISLQGIGRPFSSITGPLSSQKLWAMVSHSNMLMSSSPSCCSSTCHIS